MVCILEARYQHSGGTFFYPECRGSRLPPLPQIIIIIIIII
jgi:hypothetical protein